MKFLWFVCATAFALTTLSLSIASVPLESMHITNDTAIYQNLSEIKIPHEPRPNFDGDIARLATLEGNYRENLPSLTKNPSLLGPMKRISKQAYSVPTAPISGSAVRRKPVASAH